MTLNGYTHVALRVARLREAETFYRRLFGLDVAFREAECEDEWRTLPASVDWDDAQSAGIKPGLVMLYRDGFRLALELAELIEGSGQLSHVGVYVSEEELARIAKTSASAGCQIALNRPQALVIDDRFGIRWELNSFPYEDPPALSTGARTGRWVELD